MEKFISYQKMNKKKQKEINKQKRGNWGDIKPITKVVPNKKIYNRKAKRDHYFYGLFSNIYQLNSFSSFTYKFFILSIAVSVNIL